MTTPYKPEGSAAVTATIVTTDAKKFLAFATKVFEAKLVMELPGPDGKIMHGTFRIDGSQVHYADVMGPGTPTRSNTLVYVPDADAAFTRALDAGAKEIMPVADMFWGDRWGVFEDPWGNQWQVATHKEAVSPEEAVKRMHRQMEEMKAARK